MSGIFIRILNMSISASFVAFVIVLIRLPMKKAPKKYSYMLWAVVFFRFIAPFSIQLPVSAVPVAPQPIQPGIVSSETRPFQSGTAVIGDAVSGAGNGAADVTLMPAGQASGAGLMQTALGIGSVIWLAGVAALLLCAAINYIRLKKLVSTAILVRDDIYETDLIKTPFVLGFFHPKIYVPVGLGAEESIYIVRHEQTHIKRRDYLIKPLAFMAAAVHWFNPFAWVAYVLLARDMELSADEHVMKRSDTDIRNAYSNSLLTLSAKKNGLTSPLAFGETGISTRIKNVLKYKTPAFWVNAAAVVIVAAASVLLLGNAGAGTAASSNLSLMAYVDENYSEADARYMRRQIEAVPNVASAVFVSRQQAMAEFMSITGGEPHLEGIDLSYFRDRYVVYLEDYALGDQTINDLQSIDGISRINYNHGFLHTDFGSFNISGDPQKVAERNAAVLIRELIFKSDNIHECMVAVHILEDSPFIIASSSRPSSVSVVVTTKDGGLLSESDVESIYEAIRAVVPDIINENISITDSNLNYYTASDANEAGIFFGDLPSFSTEGFAVTREQAQMVYEFHAATEIRKMLLNSGKIQDCTVAVRLGDEPHVAILLAVNDGDIISDTDIQTFMEIAGIMVGGLKDENISIAVA